MKSTQSKDGTSIAFDTFGQGSAIVTVSGALSTRGDMRELAELLADRFTVVNYDRRGRGDSGDTPPYEPEREVEDLNAVIGEAGGSAFVLGSSSGGNLALRAAGGGLGVRKLALWEPNFIVNDSRAPLPDDYVEHLERLVAADRRSDAVDYFMTTAVGMPEEFVAQLRELPFRPGMEAVAHTIAYDGQIVGDSMSGAPLAKEAWASVKAPTLVLDGGTTPWMSDGAQAIADALPEGTRRTLKGQTHDVAADALAPALAEFFG